MSYQQPFTNEDLQRLERAIGEGVREVQYSDKKITYRSLDDMLRAAKYMRIRLGLEPGASSNSGLFGGKRLTMRPTKGLDNCSSTSEHGECERFDRNEEN